MEVEKQIAEGIISDDAMNSLSWLTKHGRTPTWLELDRFIRALGYRKVLSYRKVSRLSDKEIENERLTYLQEGDDTIDEAVLYNATIHLECLSDSAYMLIMHNARHYWHFSIFSKSGKAHLKARLLEDRS